MWGSRSSFLKPQPGPGAAPSHCRTHSWFAPPTPTLVRRCVTERSFHNPNQYSSGNRLYTALLKPCPGEHLKTQILTRIPSLEQYRGTMIQRQGTVFWESELSFESRLTLTISVALDNLISLQSLFLQDGNKYLPCITARINKVMYVKSLA